VTFDNGPVNLLDPDTLDQLGALVERIEANPHLTVVVFRSDTPGYFMAHWDFKADNARVAGMRPGPTGLHPYLDNFVRLSKLPAATISEIRGRTRGAGSEFVLATDIRFASEKAVLGQFEVGVGTVPGGGPMARLGRLVGRGRALEILLGGDDIPADLAARYGYVNRLIPDAEIDDFTDAFARRIAAFDKAATPESRNWSMWPPCPRTANSRPASRRTSPPQAAQNTGRSSNACWRTACSSPTASRPTSAPRSGGCGSRDTACREDASKIRHRMRTREHGCLRSLAISWREPRPVQHRRRSPLAPSSQLRRCQARLGSFVARSSARCLPAGAVRTWARATART
jgi:enoyl-CoA hydratase/carnithine racemase